MEKEFMSERKDFKPWAVEIVYNQQEGSCAKCGNPLTLGYHKHHINGDNSDNSIQNLQLLCMTCHGSEAWNTLQKQKEKHIGEIEGIMQQAVQGKLAGAILDKLIDAIKLSLSLERQVYGIEIEEAPATVRAEYSEYILEWNLKNWIEGFKEGYRITMEKGEASNTKKKDK